MNLVDRLRAARQKAVPIIAVASPDPAATRKMIREAFDNADSKTPIPIVEWDAINGLSGLNELGTEVLAKLFDDQDQSNWPGFSSNPNAALVKMADLPGEVRDTKQVLLQRGTIVFMHNAHRYFEDRTGIQNAVVIQGIWNLRDIYKADRRTLVLLGPAFKFPAELAQDVIAWEEPYPTAEDLSKIVLKQAENARITIPDKTVAEAVDALYGLSAFTAEQVVAMAIGAVEKGTLDTSELWERKIKVIEQNDGFTVDRGTETFDDVKGLSNFTNFGMKLVSSEKAPTLYVRIDEIEKNFAGLGEGGGPGDNTGITQDRLGVFLKVMEDEGWTGFIALGHAGCGKSLVTKALANTATKVTGKRVLSIAMDLGAIGSSLATESEKAIRACMRLIKSLAAGGRVCFVATCNKLSVLPPALKRRFKLGTWMFDLPEKDELDSMVQQYMKKYNLKKQTIPDTTNWTGADVRNVCENADLLGCSMVEACDFITFVAKSDPDEIERLRSLAHNKYTSASKPGVYQAPKKSFPGAKSVPITTGRAAVASGEEE
jgi:hypothetical protein